jgi:hypothetical protein
MKGFQRLIIAVFGVASVAGSVVWLAGRASDPTTPAKALAPTVQTDSADPVLNSVGPATSQGQQERMALKASQIQLAQDIEVIKHKLAQLSQIVTTIKATFESQKVLDEEAEANDSPSTEELKEQEAARMDQIEDEFRKEAIDTAQADHNQIVANLQTKEFKGSSLVDLECRNVTCRIESLHENRSAMDAFLADSPLLMPWDTDSVTQISEDSNRQFRTVAYFKQVLSTF